MSDRAALLAAVKAFPDADAPRLVFADWLDEHGDERDRDWAALIRWGCNPANRESRYHFPASGRLGLAFSDGTKGLSPILLRGTSAGLTFQRGFLEELECTAADWIAHADALLAEHPVRRVTLTTLPDSEWVIDSWDMIREANLNPRSSMMRDALRARWPGIEFKLPVHGTGGTLTVGGAVLPVTSWSVSNQPISPAAAPMPPAE